MTTGTPDNGDSEPASAAYSASLRDRAVTFCKEIMRHIRQHMALVICAVLVNALGAWACILWSPYTRGTAPSDKVMDRGYPPMVPGPYGQDGWWFTATGFGVWESVPAGARGAEGQFLYWRGTHTPAYYRGGWPMYSFQSTITFHNYRKGWELPVGEILRRGLQTNWLPSWLRARPNRRLSVMPYWPGFLINTLTLYVIFSSLRWGSIELKRRSRTTMFSATTCPADGAS
jgi:hypothetical protein